MSDNLPPKLAHLRRCAHAVKAAFDANGNCFDIAQGVLRESGHAELVAALARSRAWLGAGTPPDVFHEIDFALGKAGAL